MLPRAAGRHHLATERFAPLDPYAVGPVETASPGATRMDPFRKWARSEYSPFPWSMTTWLPGGASGVIWPGVLSGNVTKS